MNKTTKKQVISPIKYVGGKQRHFKRFMEYIPNKVSIMVDPFFGGGGFGLQYLDNLGCDTLVFNDYNRNIINLFKDIKDNHLEVISGLELFDKDNMDWKSYWYQLKRKIESNEIISSSELIWFNNFSMNGYISPKSKWSWNHLAKFNKQYKIDKINYCHKILNKNGMKVKFFNLDYKKMEEYDVYQDTFYYLDPPYKLKFSGQYYNIENFVLREFIEWVKTLKSKWMISFNDCALIRDAFKDYHIVELQLRYSNIAMKNQYTNGKELLIMNYVLDKGDE